MNICEDFNDLRRFALELGAKDARLIKAGDVVVRDWVRLKCRYGCSGYGKRLTCPPYSPTPDEFRRVLEGYGWAMLLKYRPKPEEDSELQKTYRFTLARESIVKLERAAFHLKRSLELARVAGIRRRITNCTMFQVQLAWRAGDFTRAAELCSQVEARTWPEEMQPYFPSEWGQIRGEFYLAQGDVDGAAANPSRISSERWKRMG